MKPNPGGERESLKGAFAAVMLLGAFIAVTWIGIYVLYIARG
ncbi:cytochrome c oxidase subunit 2A [Paenibacillus thermoaerophilus]|uniref:Cytochrome c oxidase subunit 2A n=1 Tax=Paenibacillus thermoaerophilus TaxID=1215385 RepID=A0ABW2V281_9BACL